MLTACATPPVFMSTACSDLSFDAVKRSEIPQNFSSCSVPRHQCTSVLQHAKKTVFNSPGLVDFVIGLVNSVFNLPVRQVMFFEEFE